VYAWTYTGARFDLPPHAVRAGSVELLRREALNVAGVRPLQGVELGIRGDVCHTV